MTLDWASVSFLTSPAGSASLYQPGGRGVDASLLQTRGLNAEKLSADHRAPVRAQALLQERLEVERKWLRDWSLRAQPTAEAIGVWSMVALMMRGC